MKIAIGYGRESTEEQVQSGLGLESQRQRIRAFCTMKGLNLVQIYGVRPANPVSVRVEGDC